MTWGPFSAIRATGSDSAAVVAGAICRRPAASFALLVAIGPLLAVQGPGVALAGAASAGLVAGALLGRFDRGHPGWRWTKLVAYSAALPIVLATAWLLVQGIHMRVAAQVVPPAAFLTALVLWRVRWIRRRGGGTFLAGVLICSLLVSVAHGLASQALEPAYLVLCVVILGALRGVVLRALAATILVGSLACGYGPRGATLALLLAGAAFLAGSISDALARPGDPVAVGEAASARLTVSCQRHPWVWSFCVAVAFAAVWGCVWWIGVTGNVYRPRAVSHWSRSDEDPAEFVRWVGLAILPALAGATLFHLQRGVRTLLDRSAGWVALAVTTLALWAVIDTVEGIAGSFQWIGFGVVSCLVPAAWGYGTGFGLRRHYRRANSPILDLVVFVLAAGGVWVGMCAETGTWWPSIFVFAGIAFLPVALHRFAVAEAPPLAAAALACVIVSTITIALWRRVPWESCALAGAFILAVFGVTISVARRASTLTAVPEDHPIHADFGAVARAQ